ncbi:hypothetical protein [Catenuloplanes japonicus]|uniref:hypothetical protein n=1 Tax=Catenuloplanes japonicus TaxID=33876 RepID=UPI0012FAB26B|nr:hypothetical protein [Catenuloplanes japonicus]
MSRVDGQAAADDARRGLRAWVRGAARSVRRAGPYAVLAVLAASAIAPVAAALESVCRILVPAEAAAGREKPAGCPD